VSTRAEAWEIQEGDSVRVDLTPDETNHFIKGIVRHVPRASWECWVLEVEGVQATYFVCLHTFSTMWKIKP